MGSRRDGTTRSHRRLTGSRVVVGALVASTLTLTAAAATGDVDHRRSGTGGGGRAIHSQFELAQAELAADGDIGVLLTAVDFVDAEVGEGTTTAVDVLFPDGECVATGPLDFQLSGLRRASVVGQLTAECFGSQNPSFTADVSVNVTWTGFGPVEHIRLPPDPSEPCQFIRIERRATTSGSVIIDGPDGGLIATATPTGDLFDKLLRHRDVCPSQPAS